MIRQNFQKQNQDEICIMIDLGSENLCCSQNFDMNAEYANTFTVTVVSAETLSCLYIEF